MKNLLISHFLAGKVNKRADKPSAMKHVMVAGLIQKLMNKRHKK